MGSKRTFAAKTTNVQFEEQATIITLSKPINRDRFQDHF